MQESSETSMWIQKMTWFIASLRAIKIIKYITTNFVSQARTLEVQKQLRGIISGQHFSL